MASQIKGIEGLPPVIGGTVYLVSRMVRDALGSDRPDILAPDTGGTAVRNEKGQIKAVTRLIGPNNIPNN